MRVFLRDMDGTGSMHPCAEGDDGAVCYAPIEAIESAAKDLAEYASYAEIVGGVSVNKPNIRKACDDTFEALQKLNT